MKEVFNFFIIIVLFSCSSNLLGQTIVNGFYPERNNLTFASSYSYKSFDNFYRGTTNTQANPAGMGEISSSIISLYGQYGITGWLSAVATLPYISMQNETGVLDPVNGTNQIEGVQDLSFFMKAKVYDTYVSKVRITFGGAAGVTVPVGGYEEAGILSLGNGATAIDGCGIFQIRTRSNLFVELQAAYSLRNNSNFDIPNATMYSAKLGYFNKYFYAHAKVGIQDSLSGFDIGSLEFSEAGGPNALPETEVDYTNLYLDLYVPVYRNKIGVTTGYAVNMTGRNYDRASSVSLGLVYKAK